MSAATLFAQMSALYASARTYADRGVATSWAGRLKVAFQTSFVRERRLRFEFSKDRNSTVIWSDGEHTYTYWPAGARIGQAEIIDDFGDIGLAIGAGAGASSFAASTVPALLLPVSIGTRCSVLAGIGDLAVDGEEYIGDCLCTRIDGRASGTALTRLWIDRDRYLLRRIVTFRGSELETTTSYEPSLDPIDIGSIERPDVEHKRPQPRKPVRWIGVGLKTDSRRVDRIEPDSPAARSGLTVGDEIEAVNGHSTDGLADVLDVLHEINIGEQVTLTIRRDGNTREILMQVDAAPSRVTQSSPLLE